jgi:hypothetical protein
LTGIEVREEAKTEEKKDEEMGSLFGDDDE